MKRSYLILILILLGITALSIFYYLEFESIEGYRHFDPMIVFGPLAILVAPAFFASFIATWIFPKLRQHRIQVLICTNLIGLIFAGFFIAKMSYNKIYHQSYKYSIERNSSYKEFYGDGRDSLIKLAIEAIEKRQTNVNDYKIYEMTIAERDTMQGEYCVKYYKINQLYFVGADFDTSNAFISSHVVYVDKTIQELYNQRLSLDSTSVAEWKKHKEFMNDMEKTIDGALKDSNKTDDEMLLRAKRLIQKMNR